MDLGISGKTALVAASSKGLGRAIAFDLAREGCRVVLTARTQSSLDETARQIRDEIGAEVLAVAGDVSSEHDLERIVAAAGDAYEGVDILVTNTGGPPPGTFAETGDDKWSEGIDSTLMNVIRLCRLCLPHMKSRRWGRIVHITSVSAKQPIPNLLISNALRAGVHGISKTLASEVAADGVLVNSVCPGMHLTDRLRELADVRASKSERTPEEELEAMAATIPVGRLGRPEELAAAVTFLCSDRASFITGTSLLVDGGATPGLT